MEDEYARKTGPGHGCLFSRDAHGSCAGAGKGDALYNQSLSASPAPALGPGKATGEGKDPKPSRSALPSPQSIPKPGASAAPLGAKIKAKSKEAPGRARGKGSLIRYTPGQTAKLTGM